MKKNKAQLAAKTERNGTSEDTLHDAVLKEILALSRADLGAEALAKFSTIELFLRIRGLFGNIQEAFVGQPFLPTLPPDAPANQNRVNAYMANVGRASKLLQFAIESVGMTSGMRMKPAASQARKAVQTKRHDAQREFIRAFLRNEPTNLFVISTERLEARTRR